jgi:hypothetical protein
LEHLVNTDAFCKSFVVIEIETDWKLSLNSPFLYFVGNGELQEI